MEGDTLCLSCQEVPVEDGSEYCAECEIYFGAELDE